MALAESGIHAVLTGGACATLYSRGAYQSHDLDFIVPDTSTQKAVDAAMASVGFARDGDRYIHPDSDFSVEFPRGPLAIGDDLDIRPVRLDLPGGYALALSATDACRDRLAAFYHWSDRQSLAVAVEIALRQDVNLTTVEHWSKKEDALDKFTEFRGELARRQRTINE